MDAKPTGLPANTLEVRTRIFITIPVEVQIVIASYLLRRHDLNGLCRSCKALNSIALPKLYSQLVIKIPVQFSRLDTLENLVGSSGKCLQFTTRIRISTQQHRLKAGQLGERGEKLGTVLRESVADRSQPYLPTKEASDALNAWMRLLLMKLPEKRFLGFL
ncbi:hypothetical protein MMC28_008283 [Mycoblastus sanguinarius]|nr:hypothetical protein [Mycoblastus sanguinarius]